MFEGGETYEGWLARQELLARLWGKDPDDPEAEEEE